MFLYFIFINITKGTGAIAIIENDYLFDNFISFFIVIPTPSSFYITIRT